ncbi:hypothetical protein ACWD5B_28940 [Streptomyces tanashiensis]
MTDLRQLIARSIHRYDNQHALSGNDIPSEHHYGEADAVLAALADHDRDAARQTTGQDDTACAPWTADGRHGPTPDEVAAGFRAFAAPFKHPAPAVGQPAEAQATDEARASLAALIGYEPDEHDAKFEKAVDTYRATVLREAAELGRELSRQGYSAQEIANRLDRMADEAES